MQLDVLNIALADRKSTLNTPLGEGDYLEIWQSQARDIADPAMHAAVGGVYADRLAWVFAAGYQVAVRQYFGIEAQGWLAYCASEDRSGELPGVIATESDGGWRLNGNKTWVAAVDHVERLVVAVKGRPAQHFLIEAAGAGVRLSAKPTPSFLADLSQGTAQFSDADAAMQVELSPGKPFHVLEALAIYTAFCGFVIAGFEESAAAHARSVLAANSLLWQAAMDPAEIRQLQMMDREIQQLRKDIDELARHLVPGWLTDNKLISMYSRGLQKLGS